MPGKERVKPNEQSQPYRVAATLMIWAAVSCELWVQFYQITQCHIPDDSYFRNRGCFSFETTQNTWTGCFRGFHQLLQFNDAQVDVTCKIPNSFIEGPTSFRNI